MDVGVCPKNLNTLVKTRLILGKLNFTFNLSYIFHNLKFSFTIINIFFVSYRFVSLKSFYFKRFWGRCKVEWLIFVTM